MWCYVAGYEVPYKIMWFFIFLRFYLFIWQRERKITSRQSSRKKERGKQAPCWAESLMQGLIPGPWDHDLSRRQRLNPLSHLGTPPPHFKDKGTVNSERLRVLPLIHSCEVGDSTAQGKYDGDSAWKKLSCEVRRTSHRALVASPNCWSLSTF